MIYLLIKYIKKDTIKINKLSEFLIEFDPIPLTSKFSLAPASDEKLKLPLDVPSPLLHKSAVHDL